MYELMGVDMIKDWREQGQEAYLSGLEFWEKKYRTLNESWEHDHCEFCNVKFCESCSEPDCLHEGYTTDDNYRWVCENCFHTFKEKYKLIERKEV